MKGIFNISSYVLLIHCCDGCMHESESHECCIKAGKTALADWKEYP